MGCDDDASRSMRRAGRCKTLSAWRLTPPSLYRSFIARSQLSTQSSIGSSNVPVLCKHAHIPVFERRRCAVPSAKVATGWPAAVAAFAADAPPLKPAGRFGTGTPAPARSTATLIVVVAAVVGGGAKSIQRLDRGVSCGCCCHCFGSLMLQSLRRPTTQQLKGRGASVT